MTRATGRHSTYDRLSSNLLRTLWLGFFQVFLVIMPIAVPFFQSKGLSMQEVFTLQAVFGVVVLISEVPSGYFADLFGRKQALVMGAVAAGIGHSVLVTADGFWGLVVFEVALGIGHSLISGADIALLYDTELALGRGEQAQRQIVGRLYGFRTFSEAAAAVVCSLLLLGTMETVVYVQAIIGWLPLLLSLTLSEPPGNRLAGESHLDNMRQILRCLLGGDRLLRLVFLALCIWSLTTFYAVWILQKLWELKGVELVHFGYLWAGLTVAAALAGRYAHVVEDSLGTRWLLISVGLAPALGYLGLEHFGVIGGYLASLTFFVSRGFGLVVLRDALNRRIPSEYRATANSLTSFGFRGAFVITGPLVGAGLDLWGMKVTLYLLAGGTLAIFAGLILPLVLATRGLPSSAQIDARERVGAAVRGEAG